MLVATIKGRVGYAKLLSDSFEWLKVYDIASVQLFVDETSELSLSSVQEMFPRSQVHLVEHEFKPQTSPDISTRMAFEHFFHSCHEILLNVDSDSLLHPGWSHFVETHLDVSHGLISLYNSAVHRCTYFADDYCIKGTIGALGVVMTRDKVGEVLDHVPRRLGEFDWGFVRYFQSKNSTFVVPMKSLVLHYGMHGTNGDGRHPETAVDFDESVLPESIRGRVAEFMMGRSP